MKRHWLLLLIALGLFFLVGGFIYEVTFAGIPYPDPTPELSARYAHHERVASLIYSVGSAFLFFSFLGYMRAPRKPSR